jgi:hypothetical protein
MERQCQSQVLSNFHRKFFIAIAVPRTSCRDVVDAFFSFSVTSSSSAFQFKLYWRLNTVVFLFMDDNDNIPYAPRLTGTGCRSRTIIFILPEGMEYWFLRGCKSIKVYSMRLPRNSGSPRLFPEWWRGVRKCGVDDPSEDPLCQGSFNLRVKRVLL